MRAIWKHVLGVTFLCSACGSGGNTGSNAPPVVEGFAAAPNRVAPGQVVSLTWTVSDLNGDTVSCALDADGDGTTDYTITSCNGTHGQTHDYVLKGVLAPKIQISDGRPGGEDEEVTTVFVGSQASGVALASIDSGSSHTTALDVNGDAWTWGRDQEGQIGDGEDLINRVIPVLIPAPSGVTFAAISGGYGHTLALDDGGSAWAWGRNDKGQVGTGGEVEVEPQPTQVDMPFGIAFTKVVAGQNYSLALDGEGGIWQWGRDYDWQLSSGESYYTDYYAPDMVRPEGFVDIASGAGHSIALNIDGDAYTWGLNRYGQLGNGGAYFGGVSGPVRIQMPEGVSFVAVAAGGSTSMALDATGHVWAWGSDSNGQLGDGEPKSNEPSPVQVAMPEGVWVVAISVGPSHALALDSLGRVWSWGADFLGQLGDGAELVDRAVPVRVDLPEAVQVSAVAAGSYHSLALDLSGRPWAWGGDLEGQLGDGGTNTNRATPVASDMP